MQSQSILLPIRIPLAVLLVGLASCASVGGTRGPLLPADDPDYRVYDVAAARFVSIAELADGLNGADAVFFGEFHDDPGTHRAQEDLLNLLADGDRAVVLGLEMFERDVQSAIDRYLRGDDGEGEFLEEARPWPNYRTDYRPLVEIARDQGWRVIGTNLPQALATRIARDGLASLERLPAEERNGAAAVIQCPAGAYWDRFIQAIGAAADSAAHASDDPMLRSMFEAQCARDETMAETLAPFVADEALVFHVNGAFHTDHFLGIVPRLVRRSPAARIKVLAAVPIEDLSRPPLAEHRDRADYLIFTPGPDP